MIGVELAQEPALDDNVRGKGLGVENIAALFHDEAAMGAEVF